MFTTTIRRGVTALSITALVATATPTLADKRSDDIAKGIIGIIALGAIVNAINNQNRPSPAPAPQPLPVRHPIVPAECAIEFDSTHGPAIVYSRNCMKEVGFNHPLPDCGRSARIWGERDRIYSAHCLRQAGFRF